MKLIFMGTNGWYATGLGNTVSALIETGERYIVLDAGDGIQHLDKFAKDQSLPIDIFLSHLHLDHTIGLHIQPKFMLMKNKIRIFVIPGAKKQLETLIDNPYTASFALLRKQGFDVSIVELKEGDNRLEGFNVRAAPLEHADPCFGFRFEFENGNVISYCTDTGPCPNLNKLSEGADILITECSLLPGAPVPKAWPHLNPEIAAQTALDSHCKKMYLTHFAAHLYNTKEKRLGAQEAARKIFANSYAAFDLMEVEI